MWKVLLVIASVVLGGALYLSYDNMGTFKQRLADVDSEKQTLAQRTESLKKANDEIAALEQSIQKLTDEAASLQTAKVDLDAKIVEAEANQKAQQVKLESAQKELDNARKVAGDIAQLEAIQKEMVQIRTQIEESEIELTQLEGAVAAAQVERDRLEKVAAELAALRTDQEAGVIRGEFQSQIKKAYNQWGFVVVTGGNDQGVVNRAQLDVYRRGQPICRLLVTSVEAAESIADIVPGSLAPGQRVQVGDTVVKTVRVQTPATVPAAAPGAAQQAPAAPGAEATPAGGAPDPFGGGMAPAAPAAPDPFGSPAPAAPAGNLPPDPFGGGAMGGGAAPAPAAPAADPFGAAPAAPAAPAGPEGGAAPSTPAPDPFQ
ncbi:MAG: hypothetical protein KDN18_06465 [Verrucomicrobiae bacterium]|nr:hypothetical protein [Verrucomicrobiae bacterium]